MLALMIEFADISHHQGAGAVPAISTAGYPACIVKLTEGRTHLDPRALENWAALLERPGLLIRGAYHFCRPNTDGGGEPDGRAEGEWFARNLLELGGFDDGCLPPAADIERGGMDPEHSAQMNIDFLGGFEASIVRLLGRSPMIYSGHPAWMQRLDWTLEFSHLPLWWASYTSRPTSQPHPLTFWQYTGSGAVEGVNGDVDLNRFDGSLEQLRELAVPQIWTPEASPTRGPCMPYLNLALDLPRSTDVALVQGLLYGRGASELAADGLVGPKTREAYAAFSGGGLVVDWLELLGRR